MSKLSHWFIAHERHKRFQMIVSTGTLLGSAIAILYPEMAVAGVITGTLTNLIWIWE